VPLLYPFIVNDPGEGSQAKRRSAAVIVDHLTPPATRAGSWGVQRELERLVDEFWEASTLDPRRARLLQDEILAEARRAGLDRDLDLDGATDPAAMLTRLDAHLCELKELQIRDGLHVFGRSPDGEQRTALLVALARVPRGDGRGGNASLTRALAEDLGLGIDPLTAELGTPWTGPRPEPLRGLCAEPWRTAGDTVERLELLALALVAGERAPEPAWTRSRAVLDRVRTALAAALDASGPRELAALLAGLDGRRVAPGPSGAPTRGRPEVLPTGRNFYSVDTRAVPTPAAWRLGWAAAATLLEHHLQLHGDWPRRVALSAWGTANMRTGGDDIAQALALMGCRPTWDAATGRVTGVEILPLEVLDRPRVDVTLRISGLFRDAFPAQVLLLDDAVQAVAALDEPAALNPLAAAASEETARLAAAGHDPDRARRLATARLFSAPPGAYGTGLQGLVDNDAWQDEAELGRAFLRYGGHAYGRGLDGIAAEEALTRRLAAAELVVHVQDNREHDLLDSDDYWQFEGGLAVAVRTAGGAQPEILHLDTSRPERPRACRLQEEIGRIVRGRAANPRWIEGVMRHGYKGAFEIAATVDYLFAFAATARVVGDHHFDALYDAYIADERVRAFIGQSNPAALREIAQRFQEAVRRGLWRPQRNSALATLDELAQAGR
jgi:cobaltochelatase CobN